MFCKKCGKEISDDASFCPHCGAALTGEQKEAVEAEVVSVSKKDASSPYSRTLCLIFACLGCFGLWGIHRFYVGKIGTGLLWLFTAGCFGIGTLVDIITLATGSFTDINGLPVLDWDIQ